MSLTDQVVAAINVSLDIPFVTTEEAEAKLIRSVVAPVVDFLPESITRFLLDASDGLSQAEIDRLVDLLVNVLNTKINIRFIPEETEAMVLRSIISAIFELAVEGAGIEVS